MKLSALKLALQSREQIAFKLPNGSLVPAHFHVTEVGHIHKKFIDCGGTVREESRIGLQLWSANDYNHRLHPEKLIHILELSEKVLKLEDHEIEVEYQGETINKFGLDIEGDVFVLTGTETDCLAKAACGIPQQKKKVSLSDLQNEKSTCCTPESGCC
ncbi:DUF6428 family protein [Galbibacter sp. PAP.153]|uniref:DUF6428 family protein n=1 Tax=Galbibacter sp. PAP.153 TaxID=3104623 RepID=UPI003008144A